MSQTVMKFFTAAKEGELTKLMAFLGGASDDTIINDTDSEGKTPLHNASQEGHLDIVEYLLDIGADLEKHSKKGYTALHYASRNGHLNVAQYLLEKGIDVNGESKPMGAALYAHHDATIELDLDDNEGHTPLYIASQKGHLDVVQCLVDAGADVNRAIKNGETPLYVAADQGHLDIVKYLTTTGALIDVRDSTGWTPLHAAAFGGHLGIVEYLISHGADINTNHDKGFTPVYEAAEGGHLDIVECLVNAGVDLKKSPGIGATPLYAASSEDHLEIVEYLIAKGAEIDEGGFTGRTPLLGAAFRGHRDIGKHLISHGADINIHDNDGVTPLHCASQEGHLEVVECLVDAGADMNQTNKSGATSLNFALNKVRADTVKYLITKGAHIGDSRGGTHLRDAARRGNLDVVTYLTGHGVDINTHDNFGFTPLHCASQEGHLDIVKYLISQGADINMHDYDRFTPLHCASGEGHLDLVEYLINKGADLEKHSRNGYAALHYASRNGQLNVAQYLLDKGVDGNGESNNSIDAAFSAHHDAATELDLDDNEGHTPLYIASHGGHLDVVECLVSAGADVNRAIKNGETPLYVAADKGHLDIVKYLISKGAEIDVEDLGGLTPLHVASLFAQVDVVKYLISHGADIHIRNNDGFTPLHGASQEGHLDIVKCLVDAGAEVNRVNKNNATPLRVATFSGHLDIVKYLISKGAEIDVEDLGGFTPLLVASVFGQVDVVKYLISHGADIHIRNNHGFTPLHGASQEGHLDTVECLMNAGADMNKTTESGLTSLSVASNKGRLEIVKYFFSKGAVINVGDSESITPLFAAAVGGHLDVFKYLLSHGADIHIPNNDGFTPLHGASQEGHLDIVKCLVDAGAEVNRVNKNNATPLRVASVTGNLDIDKYLISHGADINIHDNDGLTPLHSASQEGHLDIVKCLVDAGAEVNRVNKNDATPLCVASFSGHLDLVKYLISIGAEINEGGFTGKSPLSSSSFSGQVDVVKYLISHGAGINIHDNNGLAPLHWASQEGHLDIVECLVDAGADLDESSKNSETPLYFASLNGHLDIVKYLTTKGAEIYERDSRGRTSLRAAALRGHVDIVKYLISHGADINTHDNYGFTPLYCASAEGHLDIVECLVDAGADLDESSKRTATPLYVASLNGHLDIVKYLTTKGAEIYERDSRGRTSLRAAALRGHVDIVKYLISHGADINIHDNDGFTPLHYASQEGHLDIVECLMDAGADMNKTSTSCMTPLHVAAQKGHLDVVKCLINEGANVNVRNKNGETPLRVASFHGHFDVIRSLITQGANLDMGTGAGYTPIYFATEEGQLDVLDCLVNEGADVNKSANDGNAPVHAAARDGQLHIMKYLIAKGANIEARNDYGWTVLHFASDNGNLGCLDYLLSNYTNGGLKKGSLKVGEQTSTGVTPLMLATRGGHIECVRLLLDNKADVETEDVEGWTAIHYAAISGNKAIIVDLLERKPVMVRKLSRRGQAPIHVAITSGNAEITQFLLEKDSSSINAFDIDGLSPIHLATVNGLSSTIEELLSRGADVNLQSNDGQTPLHLAIKLCHCKEREAEETHALQKIQEDSDDDISTEEALIQYLINQGCKVDIKDKNGFIPVQYAKDERIRQMVFQSLKENEVQGYRDLEVKESRAIHSNVGCEGGILYMGGCDVTMSIPPRKVQAGSCDSVSVRLATDPPPIVDMLEEEFLTCPGLDIVLPAQWPYSTDQPITLTIPHAASLSESSAGHADIIWKQMASSSVHREQYLRGSDTQCMIKEREVEVTINAHSAIKDKVQLWIPMQLHQHADGKRMMCTPFLPTDMAQGEDITLRVYIHEDISYILQNIQEEERKWLYRQVHPGRCFPLEPDSKDLVLNCNGEEKNFSAKEVFNRHKTLALMSISGDPNVRSQMINVSIRAKSIDETQTSLAFMAIRSELSIDIRPKQGDMESEQRISLSKEDTESETSITKEMNTDQYYHLGVALGLSYQTLDSIQFSSRALKESGLLEGSTVTQTQKAAATMIIHWKGLQHSVSRANYHLREIWKSVCDSADSHSEGRESESETNMQRVLEELPRDEVWTEPTVPHFGYEVPGEAGLWEGRLHHKRSRTPSIRSDSLSSFSTAFDEDDRPSLRGERMGRITMGEYEVRTFSAIRTRFSSFSEERLSKDRRHKTWQPLQIPSGIASEGVPLQTPVAAKALSYQGHTGKEKDEDVDYDDLSKINRKESRPADTRDHCHDGRIAVGRFDSLGGKLSTESHGFTLDIPPGALEETASVEITLEVLTELPRGFKLEDDECLVSHGFQCYPSRLRFKKPATLTIPHCAVLTDPRRIKTVLYSWDRGTQGSPERILEPINTCLVRQHCLEISVTHFSGGYFAMIWDWLFLKSIRLSCMPFLPKIMPASRQPILEVRLVKKPHGQQWREVHRFKKSDKHQPVKDNDDVILFQRRTPSLTITCQVGDDDVLAPETVEYDDVSSEPEKTKYFTLDLNGKSDESVVILNMTQTKNQKIAFNTSFSGDSLSIPSTPSTPLQVQNLGRYDLAGEGLNLRSSNVDALGIAADVVPGPPRDPVSDEKLETLARYVPLEKYSALSVGLGIQFSESEKILAKHGNDYTKATRQSLAAWKNRTGGSLIELKGILQRVDLGGLIRHIE